MDKRLRQHGFKLDTRRVICLVAAFAGLAFLAAAIAPWLIHQLDIDRCLDAGGAYDYRNGACIGARGDE